jgi:hypothetical protein
MGDTRKSNFLEEEKFLGKRPLERRRWEVNIIVDLNSDRLWLRREQETDSGSCLRVGFCIKDAELPGSLTATLVAFLQVGSCRVIL